MAWADANANMQERRGRADEAPQHPACLVRPCSCRQRGLGQGIQNGWHSLWALWVARVAVPWSTRDCIQQLRTAQRGGRQQGGGGGSSDGAGAACPPARDRPPDTPPCCAEGCMSGPHASRAASAGRVRAVAGSS